MHGGIALRGSCEALPIPLWVRWCGATSIAANIALANAAAAQKRLRRRARVQPCMAVNVSCSDGAEVRNRSSYSLTLMTYLSKRALRINRLSTRYGLADAGVSDGDGGSSRQIPLAASDVLRPLSIRRLRRAWRWVLAARPARYSSMPFVASGVKLFWISQPSVTGPGPGASSMPHDGRIRIGTRNEGLSWHLEPWCRHAERYRPRCCRPKVSALAPLPGRGLRQPAPAL